MEQFSLAEELTDAIRTKIRPVLESSAEIKPLIGRLVQMNTRDRFRAIKFPRPTDNLLTPQRQNFTQPEWVKTVNNIYNLEDSDSSDNVDNGDPAASVYEFSPVKLSGGNDFESLATVLQGCSLVSLDELFASAVIRYLDHEKINEHALEELKFWPVKSP